MAQELSRITNKARVVLKKWLVSCTRKDRLSRNTIAVGIVILDSLREKCPRERDEMTSAGGEIKGARSGLRSILAKYEIAGFLKEATTRQVHQDGQRLLEELRYGKIFQDLTPSETDGILAGLIAILLAEAQTWLARQHLKVICSREAAPGTWIGEILDQAKGRSGGRVEQHLIGAKLATAHPKARIPVHPGTAADVQTGRSGDFQVGTTVFHVTAAPGEAVIEKCKANVHSGLFPVLLVPASIRVKAEVLTEHLGMAGRMTVMAIEDFVSVNIIELSQGERLKFIETLKAIVDEYNRRIEEAETDKSLKIDIG